MQDAAPVIAVKCHVILLLDLRSLCNKHLLDPACHIPASIKSQHEYIECVSYNLSNAMLRCVCVCEPCCNNLELRINARQVSLRISNKPNLH